MNLIYIGVIMIEQDLHYTIEVSNPISCDDIVVVCQQPDQFSDMPQSQFDKPIFIHGDE
jgi:hypothetical protein